MLLLKSSRLHIHLPNQLSTNNYAKPVFFPRMPLLRRPLHIHFLITLLKAFLKSMISRVLIWSVQKGTACSLSIIPSRCPLMLSIIILARNRTAENTQISPIVALKGGDLLHNLNDHFFLPRLGKELEWRCHGKSSSLTALLNALMGE